MVARQSFSSDLGQGTHRFAFLHWQFACFPHFCRGAPHLEDTHEHSNSLLTSLKLLFSILFISGSLEVKVNSCFA